MQRPSGTAERGTREGRHPLTLAPGSHDWLGHGALVIGLILIYLALHMVLRLNLSPTLGMDDAEQILFAQHWAAGYRFRQPPLFTWLVVPAIDLFGPGMLAVSVVRYTLLAITYLCLYVTGLNWFDDRRLAALAVFSFSSIYVFAYYAHHDLTHTTALGAMIAVTLLVFTKLAQRPTTPRYALLGLCFGLGMLAKWNFVMLAIGLPLTCLLFRHYRSLVLSWKNVIAILVMALVVTPTALWMVEHGPSAGAVSADILTAGGDEGGWAPMIEGGGALLASILLFPMPFLLVFLAVFGGAIAAKRGAWQEKSEGAGGIAFLSTLILVILGLHGLLIPLFGAVSFTERWMHPALMALPLVLFLMLERVDPNSRLILFYLVTIFILVAVAAGARLYRFVEGAETCGRCREFAPFAELSGPLGQAGFDGGLIIADGMHIGGNLRNSFPESRVVDPAFPLTLWPSASSGLPGDKGGCLLVWRADQPNADERHQAMRWFAQSQLGLPVGAVGDRGLAEAFLYRSEKRRYALGFELFREDAGGCR